MKIILSVIWAAFALNMIAFPAVAGPDLNSATKDAILILLEDERKAEAQYQAILNKFGEVRPFTNIIAAERQHQAALINLLKRYGIAVPANTWRAESMPVPTSVAEACAVGVAAEKENIELYDHYLSIVKEPDVLRVFTDLRAASLHKHLPAFERCSTCGAGRGPMRQR